MINVKTTVVEKKVGIRRPARKYQSFPLGEYETRRPVNLKKLPR